MSFFDLLIFALLQGITEFLPVSSSGHLVIAHHFLGQDNTNAWGDNLLLDVAVHVGTLFSTLVYFRRDIKDLMTGLFHCLKGNFKSQNANLFILVVVGSVPVIIAGLLLHLSQPNWLRSAEVMGWTTLIFGILLWWVDFKKPTDRFFKEITWKNAAFIGLAQILSLIPGTSRSGITMTAARYLGFNRVDAARYSLLLAIIAISGAGTLGTINLVEQDNTRLTYDLFIACGLSAISGWVAISMMMKWLKTASFALFGLYRIILGGALLIGLYSGLLT